ncbi:hypothetical protein Q31b_08750 [Novipirellula aureliae]|uniref:DUF2786 domain-containing protein n=1 Tax=Novipirellula aureliae TaxID=2527966 RepID=A0A5C6EEP0_9BACT|nr:DUF2786 domain-containing protein [Novipirellula aureliae]TWU45699.1 hypothetical protein Q31b_08750 [Novipirellula aureliae]
MEFIWNDGGRSSSGYVGLAGDCVTRSIAIATGLSYRDVYRDLGVVSNKTPRNGVVTVHSSEYLAKLGWNYTPADGREFSSSWLPKGVVIVHLAMPKQRASGHFCTMVDHIIYDTWNPSEEEEYCVVGYWMHPSHDRETTAPIRSSNRKPDAEQEMTQKEFDKVLHRLRALDNTANNNASTDGEKRNALRMMQNLMLRHNLSREDITDEDNIDSVCFTRMACPVNGRRACQWEKSLACYLTREIFPMAMCYYGTKGHRTMLWFYGPRDDVQNCIALYRELLLTIATSARLRYGGHSRGSGASYAEGYVHGLPGYESPSDPAEEQVVSETALIHARTLAVHKAARDWLKLECGVSLASGRGYGRSQHDPAAASVGKQHGSKHDITANGTRKRIAN